MAAAIPSPPANGFHVGPFDVHAYGVMYVLALVAAVAITVRRWEAVGGSRRLVYEVAAWGFPAGIIGGRLYFDITSANLVPDHWWGPFAIWNGGLGIWGGIAAGTLAGLLVLRRRGADIPRFLDAAAPALLVAQAIGRIGNYFNQELFGGPTGLPWGLEISPAHRPPGYEAFATFQPTFLYELIWNLGLAAFLVWLGRRTRRIRPPGLFALYVTGYSGFRIFEELLRVDPANHILGLRLNFVVACALTAAGAAWFVAIQRRGPRSSRPRPRRWPTLFALGWATVAAAGCAGAHSRSPGPAESAVFVSQRSVVPRQPAGPRSPPSRPGPTQAASDARSDDAPKVLVRWSRRVVGLASHPAGDPPVARDPPKPLERAARPPLISSS